jgi:hypothetical protein
MKILYRKEGDIRGVVRDVSSDIAEDLIANGTAIAIADGPEAKPEPKKPKAPVNMTWEIMRSQIPTLRFFCAGCEAKGFIRGLRGLKEGVHHTGDHLKVVSHPPAEIAERYQKIFERFARSYKGPEVSAATGHTEEQLKAYRPLSIA